MDYLIFIYFYVLSIATGCVLVIEGAPHKDFNDMNKQLREEGFDTLTLEDDFTKRQVVLLMNVYVKVDASFYQRDGVIFFVLKSTLLN